MRIALVTTEYVTEPLYDGGLANYLLRLSMALKSFAHNPVVFVTAKHQEVFDFRGIEVHRVDASYDKALLVLSNIALIHKFYRSFLYLNVSRKINSYLKKIHNQNPFDIIQYTHLMGLGLFRYVEIPSIVRLSSYTPLAMEAYELKGYYRQQNFWEELAMRRMDGIFGPSLFVSSLVKEKLKRPVRLIESPFILDVEPNYRFVVDSQLDDKKYLLFFGSIGVLKGVGSIAKILKTIFQRYSDLQFVFVGKDQGMPDGLPFVPHLFEMAGEFKDRVKYLGRLRHEELYPIIENSLAVILPSRIENFSNACIEAMAHKKIVIGTRGTSFEQLIEDGKNGFLCEVDNEQSLLEVIEKVMSLNERERELIGKRAWERTKKLHPDIVVKQLLDYYTEVIALKHQKSFVRQG